jgi:DNA-binding Lrp family transcriptional regulator
MTAKRKLVMTERDVRILKLLKDFGVVSSDQLGRWIFMGIERTTALRRLRILENANYIRKRGTLPDATAVWVIEPDGTRILSGVAERDIYPLHQLPHEMTLNEIRWTFYSLDLVQSWMTERDLRRKIAREHTYKKRTGWLVPDGLVLFQKFWKENFHARIEVELTLKSDQKYEVLIEKYHERFEKEQIFTWYFVKSQKMGNRLLMLAKKYGGPYIDKHFGFTVIDEFLKNPWQSRLYTLTGYYDLRRLIQYEEPKLPAQDDAQGVSGKIEDNSKVLAA